MKFSIIIPVWNTECYLKKCLDSVRKQTYQNYEVILLNDGSPDHSDRIIEEFCKSDHRFISYKKKNTGVSDTRNVGVSKVTGDYILFLDSDDYYNDKLLEEINKKCNNADLVKFGCQLVEVDNTIIKQYHQTSFEDKNEIEALKLIATDDLLDSPCIYAFKTDFYKNNHFAFSVNRRHEDFGLIPFILLKAHTLQSISYIGYNYVKVPNSYINTNTTESNRKKFIDFFQLYKSLVQSIVNTEELQEKKDIILIYITDAVIRKYNSLEKSLKKEFRQEFKSARIYDNMPSDTIKRRLKKIVLRIHYKCYLALTSMNRK